MTTATESPFVSELRELGACSDAVSWAANYSTPEEAWAACERGDWLLWICGRLSGPPESEGRKKLVLYAATYAAKRALALKECADIVRKYYPTPPSN